MKYVIIHGDGMADWPCDELGGKTPLEAAHKPNMDLIATRGTLGLTLTIPEGMPPGSDVGTMSMMGYDPKRYHTGRAPIEAASMGIAMGPNDVVFRMNLVSLKSEGATTVMNDFTSGHITSEEASRIVADLREQLGGDGVSYRHLMMWRDGARTTKLTPPHDITGQTIEGRMPEGEGADRILALMKKSQEILREHPVNQARRAAGKVEATSAWFWGQGTRPAVPTLKERFGLEGSVISAVDLVNGVGRLAGLEVITVPGATGFLDTDYAAKGRYGLKSLEHKDFLLLHIEAPDEAGHMGRADLKKEAIERIDELILGPMLDGLSKMGDFRLLLQPDHATPSKIKTHSSEAVPFAIISNRTFRNLGAKSRRYTEADGKATGTTLTDGYRLIETLFNRGGAIEAN
jgi:2,3-bisphosphoglycerate-independent phosphoglycerate mutase